MSGAGSIRRAAPIATSEAYLQNRRLGQDDGICNVRLSPCYTFLSAAAEVLLGSDASSTERYVALDRVGAEAIGSSSSDDLLGDFEYTDHGII